MQMGYVIPVGFARITFEYGAVSTLGSQVCWGIGVSRDPNSATLADVREWAEDLLLPATSDAYELQRIVMRNDVNVIEEVLNNFGASPDQVSPPNTALLVKLTTDLIGRKNRGRMYIPGVLRDTEVNNSGVIQGAALDALEPVITGLFTALLITEAEPVILHSDESEPTPVTGGTASAQVATQRRRQRA